MNSSRTWSEWSRSFSWQVFVSVLASILASAMIAIPSYFFVRAKVVDLLNTGFQVIDFDRVDDLLAEAGVGDPPMVATRRINDHIKGLMASSSDMRRTLVLIEKEVTILREAVPSLGVPDSATNAFDREEFVPSAREELMHRLNTTLRQLSAVRQRVDNIEEASRRLLGEVTQLANSSQQLATQHSAGLLESVREARIILTERRDAMLESLERLAD